MLINKLAKRTGVSIHTLRYYENLGFFKGSVTQSVEKNNYKNYDESLVSEVSLIRQAKEIGFTLVEIKTMLEKWADDKISTSQKAEVFREKISEITSKIKRLKEMKIKLLKVLEDIENGEC